MAENIEEASALQADVNNTETGSVGVKPLVFEINRNAIESVVFENQPEELRALGLTIYDQSKFEEGVLRQVDSALEEQERVKKVKEAKHKIGPKKNDKSEKSGSHETPTLPTQREETQQDRLIRLGHMTPFGTILNAEKKTDGLTSFEKYLLEQENLQKLKKKESKGKVVKPKKDQPSATHDKNIAKPEARKEAEANNCIPVTSKRKHSAAELRPTKNKHSKSMKTHSDSDYSPSEESKGLSSKGKKRKKKETEEWNTDDSDWIYSDEETESKSSKRSSKKARMVDDGNLQNYKQRLTAWENDPNTQNDDCEEFEGGFKLPNRVWDQLYNYQKVGVRWMWELHLQKCGGILGDEMGLGKTVQAIAFLAGLSHSRLINHQSNYRGLGPVLLVTPATVMSQWVKEFHTWWPPLRVAILHDSGSHVGQKDSLIKSINHSRGVLITSYSGVVQHRNQLLARDWDYVILDEGHKIRNPDAQATLVVKQFRTCHRFICSGSPMQNNLKELWSLFDFIFPGKLGTLPVFLQQFAVPITHGGYANASEVQVATAFKCATILRDTIAPYLLRRMKADVRDHLRLPDKNEQVLFCQLTEEQRNLYKGYLASGDIKSIIDGRLQIFVGLTNLRKICNHPHLFASERGSEEDGDDSSKGFGAVEHSGKMLVIDSLLRIWNEQQHRVLLFSQSKQMLDILETFIQRQGYTYLRLDGTTSIGSRQPMIERYNSDPSIFVFLLTTRVGGLGVNLTGADRVVIYDPDWNPSTDTQARERAWRIGQKKNVTVYRLLTSGTIEEKIYHRQIFKQYLTNRVLKDPKQRRFFKSNDLYELFTLKEADAQGTETEAIFAGTGSEVATNHEAAERAQSSKTSDDDWMKNWQKERDKREAAWKKKLRLEQERTEAKSSNASSSQAKEARKLRKKLKSERRAEKQKKLEVDGHKVTNVLKKSTYQPSEDQDDSSRTAAHDDYVLQRLFAKTGVVSALRHDSIVNAGDPDYVLVEGEAERVAQQAVQELKRSRRSCWNAQSGVPSWTGQNGVVRSDQNPAPAKPRFGSKKKTTTVIGSGEAADAEKATELPESADKSARLSSSDLLKRMQKRNRLLGVPSDRSSNEDARSSLQAVNEEETFIMGSDSAPLEFAPDVDYKTILDDLRSYVAFRGVVPGQVSTQDLLDEFNVKLPPRSAPIFRAFLKELCDFHRDVNGQGMWQLKPEFR